MKYVRKWCCAICGQPVIIDTGKLTQSCGCIPDPQPSVTLQNNLKNYMQTADFDANYELLCLSMDKFLKCPTAR